MSNRSLKSDQQGETEIKRRDHEAHIQLELISSMDSRVAQVNSEPERVSGRNERGETKANRMASFHHSLACTGIVLECFYYRSLSLGEFRPNVLNASSSEETDQVRFTRSPIRPLSDSLTGCQHHTNPFERTSMSLSLLDLSSLLTRRQSLNLTTPFLPSLRLSTLD